MKTLDELAMPVDVDIGLAVPVPALTSGAITRKAIAEPAAAATVFYMSSSDKQQQHCYHPYKHKCNNSSSSNDKENNLGQTAVSQSSANPNNNNKHSTTWLLLPLNIRRDDSLLSGTVRIMEPSTSSLDNASATSACKQRHRQMKALPKSKITWSLTQQQHQTSLISVSKANFTVSSTTNSSSSSRTVGLATELQLDQQQQNQHHRPVQQHNNNNLIRDHNVCSQRHCQRYKYQPHQFVHVEKQKQQQQKIQLKSSLSAPLSSSSSVLLQHPKYHQQKEKRKQRHFVGHIGTTSFLTLITLICLETLILSTVSDCAKTFYMHWNTSNSIFRIDNTDHIIDVNKGNLAFEFDQVHIICPVYEPGTYENETEKYIIYNVSKVEYETCRITNADPRVIAICDKPQKLMFFTITFRPFTPQPGGLEFLPGNDYYFISTSSKDDLYRRIGGRCSTNNMKVVFKVCCAPDDSNKTLAGGGHGSAGGSVISIGSAGNGMDVATSTSSEIAIGSDSSGGGGHHQTNTALSNSGLSTSSSTTSITNNNNNNNNNNVMSGGGNVGPNGGVQLKPINAGSGGTFINSNVEQYNRNNGINVITNNIDGMGHHHAIGGGIIGNGLHHHHRGYEASGGNMVIGGSGNGNRGSGGTNVGGIILTPNHLGGGINVMSTNGIGIGGYLNVGGGDGSGNIGQPGTGIRINNVPTHQQQHHHNNQQQQHSQYKPNMNGNNINSNKMNINANGNDDNQHMYNPKHPNEVVKNEELTYKSAAATLHSSKGVQIEQTLVIFGILWQWIRSFTSIWPLQQYYQHHQISALSTEKCQYALHNDDILHFNLAQKNVHIRRLLKDNCNCMQVMTITTATKTDDCCVSNKTAIDTNCPKLVNIEKQLKYNIVARTDKTNNRNKACINFAVQDNETTSISLNCNTIVLISSFTVIIIIFVTVCKYYAHLLLYMQQICFNQGTTKIVNNSDDAYGDSYDNDIDDISDATITTITMGRTIIASQIKKTLLHRSNNCINVESYSNGDAVVVADVVSDNISNITPVR